MQRKRKKYLFFVFLFFAGLWFATGREDYTPQTIALTDKDNATTLTIKKGQLFTLTLPDHIDGGYRFDTIQYDAAIITLQKHAEDPPAPNSPPGRAGTGTWVFIALKKGKTAVRVNATRPWKGGGTVTVFENNVMVN